jgi:hypothetical protein
MAASDRDWMERFCLYVKANFLKRVRNGEHPGNAAPAVAAEAGECWTSAIGLWYQPARSSLPQRKCRHTNAA